MRQSELDKKCFDAVSAGDVNLVAQCVSEGANVNVRDESCGYLPICIAAHLGHDAVADFLLHNGAVMDHSAQLAAVHMGHAAVLRVLLDNGADPNWSHPNTGETPLHVATFSAYLAGADECVRHLVAAGANVNSRTKNRVGSATFDGGYVAGETPLHNAAAYGSAAMIRLLIDAGADVLAQDADGHTPRQHCARHQRGKPHTQLERNDFAQVLDLLPYGEPSHPSSPEKDDADI